MHPSYRPRPPSGSRWSPACTHIPRQTVRHERAAGSSRGCAAVAEVRRLVPDFVYVRDAGGSTPLQLGGTRGPRASGDPPSWSWALTWTCATRCTEWRPSGAGSIRILTDSHDSILTTRPLFRFAHLEVLREGRKHVAQNLTVAVQRLGLAVRRRLQGSQRSECVHFGDRSFIHSP